MRKPRILLTCSFETDFKLRFHEQDLIFVCVFSGNMLDQWAVNLSELERIIKALLLIALKALTDKIIQVAVDLLLKSQRSIIDLYPFSLIQRLDSY